MLRTRSAKDVPIVLLQSPVPAVLTRFRGLRGLVLALAMTAPLDAGAQSLQLESDTDVATAGYYQLRWYSASPVILEESQTAEFASPRVIYHGSDAARVMSGKPDGDLYYRIRSSDHNAPSNVVKVTVRHHSLERAFAFFALGATVFVATLLLIVTGARAGTSH
jgi:hypothetical protein